MGGSWCQEPCSWLEPQGGRGFTPPAAGGLGATVTVDTQTRGDSSRLQQDFRWRRGLTSATGQGSVVSPAPGLRQRRDFGNSLSVVDKGWTAQALGLWGLWAPGVQPRPCQGRHAQPVLVSENPAFQDTVGMWPLSRARPSDLSPLCRGVMNTGPGADRRGTSPCCREARPPYRADRLLTCPGAWLVPESRAGPRGACGSVCKPQPWPGEAATLPTYPCQPGPPPAAM